MDKIIVEIKCPASAKSYEFRISKKLLVNEGIEKIISEICGIEQNDMILSKKDSVSLFNSRMGNILCADMTFVENGVKSGDTLMIV